MSQDESYAAGLRKLSAGELEDKGLYDSGLQKKKEILYKGGMTMRLDKF